MEWISPIFTAFAIVVFLIYEGYFKEKGKNLATKEDIGDITKDIETIKNNINFEKQRENDFLVERKKKLMSFIPVGISHKHLLLKVLYSHNRFTDLQYIRSLYNEVYTERLKAETLFYECLSYTDNKVVIKALTDLLKVINDVSNSIINTIHDIEFNASIRSKTEEDRNYIDLVKQIDKNLEDSYKNFEKLRKSSEIIIRDAMTNYSVFLGVLNDNGFHQKR